MGCFPMPVLQSRRVLSPVLDTVGGNPSTVFAVSAKNGTPQGEESAPAGAFLSSHRVNAGGYPERISDDPSTETSQDRRANRDGVRPSGRDKSCPYDCRHLG